MELFIFESSVFEQKALYRADFLSVTSDYRGQCLRVGGGVQNLGHLRFFFNKPVFMSFSELLLCRFQQKPSSFT